MELTYSEGTNKERKTVEREIDAHDENYFPFHTEINYLIQKLGKPPFLNEANYQNAQFSCQK